MNKTIYLAGGCFWGLEELIRQRPGVVDTEVGYMGGTNDNPTYEHHPGHAEAVAITYDDSFTNSINFSAVAFSSSDYKRVVE